MTTPNCGGFIPPHPLLTSYTGHGYTIGYPQNWNIAPGSDGAVRFTDPPGKAFLLIRIIANPNGTILSDVQVRAGLHSFQSGAQNYHQLDVPTSTIVGGETWSQGAATGEHTVNGQTTTVQLVVIVDNHPAHAPTTNSFVIEYEAPTQGYNQVYTNTLQPMLQSFRFL